MGPCLGKGCCQIFFYEYFCTGQICLLIVTILQKASMRFFLDRAGSASHGEAGPIRDKGDGCRMEKDDGMQKASMRFF